MSDLPGIVQLIQQEEYRRFRRRISRAEVVEYLAWHALAGKRPSFLRKEGSADAV